MKNKYQLLITSRFKKDLKLCIKRGKNISRLEKVVNTLVSGEPLPQKYHDHSLIGNYSGHRECRIDPDWLLVYYIDNCYLTLTLTRTGTHSDLF